MLCCNLVDRCSFPASFSPLGATRLTRKPIPKLSPTNTHVMTCNQLRSRYGLGLSNTPDELKRRIFCNGHHRHHKHIACEIHGRAQTHCHKLYTSMKRSALPSPETDLHPSGSLDAAYVLISGAISLVASIFPIRGINGKAGALT